MSQSEKTFGVTIFDGDNREIRFKVSLAYFSSICYIHTYIYFSVVIIITNKSKIIANTNDKNMVYEEFIEEVLQQVNVLMKGEYSVSKRIIEKNNNNQRTALLIRKKDDHIVPTIYLEEFFTQYKNGDDIKSISQDIIALYQKACDLRPEPIAQFLEFEEMREKIYYRIVNYKKNQKQLEKMVYRPFLDLAITFHCMVHQSDQNVQSIAITKEMLSYWEITSEELWEIAQDNTPNLLEGKICLMKDLLKEMYHNHAISAEQSIVDVIEANRCEPMYILTNVFGVNGAAVVLYPKLLKKVSKALDTDLILLPSSIHEWIVIPKSFGEQAYLQQMVQEINATEVAEEEVLSDTIYQYNRKQDVLEIACAQISHSSMN